MSPAKKKATNIAVMTFHQRILLVDDEPQITGLLRHALEATGRYLIQEENQSRRALQTARRFRPDLVLLDVLMPELDGREIARQMQADLSLQDVPIIFVSGLTSDGRISTQGFLDGYTFIAKPFDFADLIGCIEELLGNGVASSRQHA